jgi:phage shock protein A
MKQDNLQKDQAYWAHLARLAEEASSRKLAVSLLHELQRHNDRVRGTNPIF